MPIKLPLYALISVKQPIVLLQSTLVLNDSQYYSNFSSHNTTLIKFADINKNEGINKKLTFSNNPNLNDTEFRKIRIRSKAI